jgi:hypothetical protein
MRNSRQAFSTNFINPLIEAKHRDHRTLGQKLESLVNTPWKNSWHSPSRYAT